MLFDLVPPLFRARLSLHFEEISQLTVPIMHFTACTIWIFHLFVHDCTFFAPTEILYFQTVYASSFMLICYLI